MTKKEDDPIGKKKSTEKTHRDKVLDGKKPREEGSSWTTTH